MLSFKLFEGTGREYSVVVVFFSECFLGKEVMTYEFYHLNIFKINPELFSVSAVYSFM